MLFNQIVYGPIHSRRLGVSLGMNLMPTEHKLCTFNCVYCECGWNEPVSHPHIPTRKEVRTALEAALQQMVNGKSSNGQLFEEYHGTLTEEQVRLETARCLGCGASVVDTNKCIGCGLCTTKCAFDAIHLTRDLPEASHMVTSEDKFSAILPYMVKRAKNIVIKGLAKK